MLRSSTEVTAEDRQLLQEEVCWICLDGDIAGPGNQLLISPCKCPRKVHPTCMARWQLQQAGSKEETHCRFCSQELTDWKEDMTPKSLRDKMEGIQPIMVVYSQGVMHRIPVNPGEEGLEEFRRNIRELFHLTEDDDISFTFGCKVPLTGEQIKLKGECSYNAAIHCATAAAADLKEKKAKHQVDSGNTATPSPFIQGTSNTAASIDTQAALSHASAPTALWDTGSQEGFTTALNMSDASRLYTRPFPQVAIPCEGSRTRSPFLSQTPETAGHPQSRHVQSSSVRNVDSRQPVDLHQASSSWYDGYPVAAATLSQPSAGLMRLDLSHIMPAAVTSPRPVSTEETQPIHTESERNFSRESAVMATDRIWAAENPLLRSIPNPLRMHAATEAAVDRMWESIVQQSNESAAQDSRMEQWPLQMGPFSPFRAELGGCGGAAGSQDVESAASVEDGLVGTRPNESEQRSFPHSKRRRSEEGCHDM